MDTTNIITQGRRMCKAHPACRGCPLVSERCNPLLGDIDRIAAIILDWSSSHPEPRLPTWAEWWSKLPSVTEVITVKGIKIERSMSGLSVFLFDPSDRRAMVFAINSCIPSDLAERLGIKPINTAKE